MSALRWDDDRGVRLTRCFRSERAGSSSVSGSGSGWWSSSTACAATTLSASVEDATSVSSGRGSDTGGDMGGGVGSVTVAARSDIWGGAIGGGIGRVSGSVIKGAATAARGSGTAASRGESGPVVAGVSCGAGCPSFTAVPSVTTRCDASGGSGTRRRVPTIRVGAISCPRVQYTRHTSSMSPRGVAATIDPSPPSATPVNQTSLRA
jgi:hypothetical protein